MPALYLLLYPQLHKGLYPGFFQQFYLQLYPQFSMNICSHLETLILEWIFGHTLKPWCSNECFLCIFNGMYVKAMPGLVKCFWCNLGYKVAQNIHAICLSHSNLHHTSTCWAVSSLLYKWKHENVNLAFLNLILLLVLFLQLSPISRPPFGWHKPEILFGTRLYSNYFWKEHQEQRAFGCLSLIIIIIIRVKF